MQIHILEKIFLWGLRHWISKIIPFIAFPCGLRWRSLLGSSSPLWK